MSDSSVPIYSFHKAVQEAYLATHSWLLGRPEVKHYCELDYEEVKKMLEDPTLLSTAAQFQTYFPAHYFKVIHCLEQVIAKPRLIEWFRHNQRICVVDVGCGAGAASAAFVETVLGLQESGAIKNSVQIYCLGVDPNAGAVALYSTFLEKPKLQLLGSDLDIVCDLHPVGLPRATSQIIQALTRIRQEWNIPNLPHVVVMQVNLVSPLDRDYKDQQVKYQLLADLGIETSDSASEEQQFGFEQALAYRSILENVAIDHMHIMTVSTNRYLLGERVEEMGTVLSQVFDGSSHLTRTSGGKYRVSFFNPRGSRWEWNRNPVERPFYANVTSVTNRDWERDVDWHEIVGLDNLRLAWARARYELLKDSFIDELEIRLFESDLNGNLEQMRGQLIAYAEEVTHVDDYVAYKVPKGETSSRPRGLSAIEEELLSVAIVQKLGQQEEILLRQCSYAYRIQDDRGRATEYLYEYWLTAYKAFIEDAREEARKDKYSEGAVLRTDIKSFYTQIEQAKLVRLTAQTLTKNKSLRIEWLIRLLLSRNLDEHEVGRGIVQGNIGSGFYANIYLTAVDMCFGSSNVWGVKFYRYVDDMILLIPEQEDGRPIELAAKEVKSTLEDALSELNLELNENKTELYYSTNDFIQHTEPDSLLEDISDEYDALTDQLWILDDSARSLFVNCADNNDLWWYRVKLYCRCLQDLGIFIVPALASRWIHRYLFNPDRRKRDRKGNAELSIPELPTEESDSAFQNWVAAFREQNAAWTSEREQLTSKLSSLFTDAWDTLSKPDESLQPFEQRKLETRLRFALSRLSTLGFGQVMTEVLDVVCESPWITKSLSSLIESLARQGYSDELLDLLLHYARDDRVMCEYIRAVLLRAMRFLPAIYEENWDSIVQYTLQGAFIEQLMASETWLFLRGTPGFYEQEESCAAIREELTKNVPRRLAKNYLLLLSEYDSEIPRYDFEAIPTLRQAYRVSSRRDAGELLNYVEPGLIRSQFYGGRRAGDTDSGHTS